MSVQRDDAEEASALSPPVPQVASSDSHAVQHTDSQPTMQLRPLPPGPKPAPARPAVPFAPPLRKTRVEPAPRPLDRAALDGLRLAITNSNIYEGDYVNLAKLGDYLKKVSPDLNARNYGFQRLQDFVVASGMVEVRMKSKDETPPIALVRLKG